MKWEHIMGGILWGEKNNSRFSLIPEVPFLAEVSIWNLPWHGRKRRHRRVEKLALHPSLTLKLGARQSQRLRLQQMENTRLMAGLSVCVFKLFLVGIVSFLVSLAFICSTKKKVSEIAKGKMCSMGLSLASYKSEEAGLGAFSEQKNSLQGAQLSLPATPGAPHRTSRLSEGKKMLPPLAGTGLGGILRVTRDSSA